MLTAYVIRNPRGAVYIGQTRSLAARLRRHNGGEGAPFTKNHGGPWEVAWTVEAPTREAAADLEGAWTAELTRTGKLPFLSFEPTAWNRTHRDYWRHHGMPEEAARLNQRRGPRAIVPSMTQWRAMQREARRVGAEGEPKARNGPTSEP